MTDTPASWLSRVNAAAALFEARWTLRALRRVDPELHRKLVRQRELWGKAYVTGTKRDVEQHGAAMIRGWEAVIRAMEGAVEPHDAYLEGFDAATGRRVAIGLCKASAGVLEPGTVFLTPDDVAALLGGPKALIGDILAMWPGAEIGETRETREHSERDGEAA